MEVLSALGEPTMQSLAWHIGRSGVSVAPDDFDIKKFHASLYELMGGADILVEQVARGMAEGKSVSGAGRIRTSDLQRPRLASCQARQRPPRKSVPANPIISCTVKKMRL